MRAHLRNAAVENLKSRPGPGPRGTTLYGLLLEEPISVPPAFDTLPVSAPEEARADQLDAAQPAHGIVTIDGVAAFECERSPWVNVPADRAFMLHARCKKCGGLILRLLPPVVARAG